LALEEDEEEDGTPLPTSPNEKNAEYVEDDGRRGSPSIDSSGRNGVPGSRGRKGNGPHASPDAMGRNTNNGGNGNASNGSPNRNGGSPTPLRPLLNSRNNSLALHSTPSMTAVDNSQIDACLQDTMMLNVDDYLNSNVQN